MVHRDIKPANLFLVNPPRTGKALPNSQEASARTGAEPTVKILDWGLARLVGSRVENSAQQVETSVTIVREQAQLAGSADYIAPEQSRDASLVDIRADIYSMGCTFFFFLSGRPPFAGNSLMEKLLQHRDAPPPPVQQFRPEVPDELADIVARMMAKKPEDRFSIPLLVVGALRRFTTGQCANGIPARPGSWLNLTRPASSPSINRPASATDLPRPAISNDRPGGSGLHRRS
jgi:serine/threonine-protein kinase